MALLPISVRHQSKIELPHALTTTQTYLYPCPKLCPSPLRMICFLLDSVHSCLHKDFAPAPLPFLLLSINLSQLHRIIFINSKTFYNSSHLINYLPPPRNSSFAALFWSYKNPHFYSKLPYFTHLMT